MSDFNLMNFLIDKEDRKIKSEECNMDTSMWDYTSSVGDDFLNFDSFLKMEDDVPSFNLLDDASDIFDSPLDSLGTASNNIEGSVCSDSGVSSTLSPPHLLFDEDQMSNNGGIIVNDLQGNQNDMFDTDVDILDSSSVDTTIITLNDSAPASPTPVLSKSKPTTVSTTPIVKTNASTVFLKNNKNKHVHTLTSSTVPKRKIENNYEHSPSILIPVNLPGVKTIKVVNASGKPLSQETLGEISQKTGLGNKLKFLNTGAHSPCQSVSTSCTDDEDDEIEMKQEINEQGECIYPKLELTYEERRLMDKEGVKLPSHYPLTKLEERELKRIRRKIRNKISAQDSRKRKKEYVDGLEERVKKCTEENVNLIKRIKLLESRNHNLCSQLRKIQALLTNKSRLNARLNANNANGNSSNNSANSGGANTNNNQVPSSTCLMVLCLSLALILAPNLQNGSLNENINSVTDGLADLNLPLEKNIQETSSGRSRSLLFTKYALQQKPSPMMSEIQNSELVDDAYTKFLNSQGYAKGNLNEEDDNKNKNPNGEKQNKLGLSALMSDLSELLNFQPNGIKQEKEIIDVEGTFGKLTSDNNGALYDDHNYGKPVRKRCLDSPVDDYPPNKKSFEPLVDSILKQTTETLKQNEILDSPVDDFRPIYATGSTRFDNGVLNRSKQNDLSQSSMILEFIKDEIKIE